MTVDSTTLGLAVDATDTSIKDTEVFDTLPPADFRYDSSVTPGATTDFDTES